ncbi:cation-translocating P-type ATPase [Kocuria sp. LUK]|nr:cation-translocating P-type ATPase [Kocuria sp. LUK]MCD1145810.1 cation-translocating P-type ATPase [Kocuria sp. LUK]
MAVETGPRVPDPSLRPAHEVLAELGTDPERGLSGAEAAARLARYGPNELRPVPPVPLWRRLLARFRDPLVTLLLVAIVVSLGAWAVEGARGLPVDALVIAAVVLLNAVLGLVQEVRAEDAVAALAELTAASSTVLRDGRLTTVPSAELVPGDLLVLAEGDAVGADARLLSAAALRVQEASLTGESEAELKDPAVLAAPAVLGDRTDMVYRGTAVAQGVGRAVVTGTGPATEMGAIADMLERTRAEETPLQKEIAAVSRSLGLLVVAVAVVVMVAVVLVHGVSGPGDLVTVLLLGVSLAVAAVPEGLPAILSLVLALGVRAMARRNAVLKDLHSVEALGAASVICSDKTGTLTRNEMTLTRVVTASGTAALSGTGYGPEGGARVVSGAHAPVLVEARAVLVGGARANNAQLDGSGGQWTAQGDPTEAAFLAALPKLPGAADAAAGFGRLAEVPFTSERRMMSVVDEETGTGEHRLFTKGAPDELLARCSGVLVGDAVEPLDAARRAAAAGAAEALSAEAFRVLAVAARCLPGTGEEPAAGTGVLDVPAGDGLEHDLVWLGAVGIIDPPREEAGAAVARARAAGVRTVMITGDHPATAGRIAADLGIAAPGGPVLTGAQLDALTDEELVAAARGTAVFARVAPAHKLRIVAALQADGHVVAMTGDGVNDAPALKAADIGVAMGITGTEVTKQAGRMVLGDDDYATIVAAVHQGRVVFDNIEKFLRYLLSSNIGEVATVFLGVVLAGVLGLTGAGDGTVALPLLATQILWINLVTDSGPALAMGVDPELDDVMARPPRRPGDRILDRAMWLRVGRVGLVMAGAALLTLDVLLPGGLVAGHESLELARTASFTTLVLAQLFNALNSRSGTSSAFHRLFTNRWLWAALLLGAGLQVLVVHLPPLQAAFGTRPLEPAHWVLAVGAASLVLWTEELAKLLRRVRAREPAAGC